MGIPGRRLLRAEELTHWAIRSNSTDPPRKNVLASELSKESFKALDNGSRCLLGEIMASIYRTAGNIHCLRAPDRK
jgi:hypothetical protein